jgi:hypothetical protein
LGSGSPDGVVRQRLYGSLDRSTVPDLGFKDGCNQGWIEAMAALLGQRVGAADQVDWSCQRRERRFGSPTGPFGTIGLLFGTAVAQGVVRPFGA